MNEHVFKLSCQNGHFEIAKWLYNLGNVNIHAENDYAFRWSCKKGHYEIAKWLHSLGAGRDTDYSDLFINSLIMGYVEMAQWLYSLSTYEHIDYYTFFLTNCSEGRVEMAKWLYSLGVNVRAENDTAFKYSCHRRCFEITKWLYKICPMIIPETIKDIPSLEYEKLGISSQSAILFECIKNGTEFLEIDDIDDCILHSLKHYNMIDQLTKLSAQFPYIYFEVDNGVITEFVIQKVHMKSARVMTNI